MSHPPLHSCTRAQRHTHRRPEPSAPRFFFSLSFNWVISIHLSSNSLIFLQSIVCPDDFSFLFNLLSSRISIKFFPVYIFLLKFSTASSVKLHCPLCEYIFRSHFKVFVTGNMHYLRFDFCWLLFFFTMDYISLFLYKSSENFTEYWTLWRGHYRDYGFGYHPLKLASNQVHHLNLQRLGFTLCSFRSLETSRHSLSPSKLVGLKPGRSIAWPSV